jgi:hypothetical protein
MSGDFPKVMHPARRVQCLHRQQEAHDCPSAVEQIRTSLDLLGRREGEVAL